MVSECPLVKNRGGTVLREDWKPHPLAEDIAHWAKPLADKIRVLMLGRAQRPTTVESVGRDEGDGTRARRDRIPALPEVSIQLGGVG
jgi:hypothetical protein